MSDHSQVILFLRAHPRKTSEEITQEAQMSPRTVRRVLKGLADSGLAFDDASERWCVSSLADPDKPLVRSTFISTEKKRKRQRKQKAKTADLRTRLHTNYLECVRLVALRLTVFTADDVRREFDSSEFASDMGMADPRLSGPVMLHAQKAGYCRRSDRSLVSERRRNGLTQVYISLICEKPGDTVDLMSLEELRTEVRRLRASVPKDGTSFPPGVDCSACVTSSSSETS